MHKHEFYYTACRTTRRVCDQRARAYTHIRFREQEDEEVIGGRVPVRFEFSPVALERGFGGRWPRHGGDGEREMAAGRGG